MRCGGLCRDGEAPAPRLFAPMTTAPRRRHTGCGRSGCARTARSHSSPRSRATTPTRGRLGRRGRPLVTFRLHVSADQGLRGARRRLSSRRGRSLIGSRRDRNSTPPRGQRLGETRHLEPTLSLLAALLPDEEARPRDRVARPMTPHQRLPSTGETPPRARRRVLLVHHLNPSLASLDVRNRSARTQCTPRASSRASLRGAHAVSARRHATRGDSPHLTPTNAIASSCRPPAEPLSERCRAGRGLTIQLSCRFLSSRPSRLSEGPNQ